MKRKATPHTMSAYAQMVARVREPTADRRKRHKRLTYSPVMRTVVEHKEDQGHTGMLAPGRWGKRWEYVESDLVRRASYDPEAMALVRKAGGLKALINKMFPMLNPERKMAMLSDVGKMISKSPTRDKRTGKLTRRVPGGIASIIQAKKKAYDAEFAHVLVPVFVAKQGKSRTRKEKRTAKSALARLKARLAFKE